MSSETVSPALLSAYSAWKARKIANLPTAQQWAERRRAKFTPERRAIMEERIAQRQARALEDARKRFAAQAEAVKGL